MTIYRGENDGIEGERIICQFSKLSSQKLIHESEAHRGTQVKLHDAYCVITKPLRTTLNKE